MQRRTRQDQVFRFINGVEKVSMELLVTDSLILKHLRQPGDQFKTGERIYFFAQWGEIFWTLFLQEIVEVDGISCFKQGLGKFINDRLLN